MKVGYLGPKGSFSEIAANTLYKDGLVAYPSLNSCFKALTNSKIDSAVVPIENTINGTITTTLDALFEHDVKINNETLLKIDHSILGVKNISLGNIDTILSHPSALVQCERYISKNMPNAKLIGVSSTSEAAKMVQDKNDPKYIAIGNEKISKLFDLLVLDKNIQDNKENYTRFISISNQDSPQTGDDKTSIIFYFEKNRPGTLYNALGIFSQKNINLTKIESRPTKKELGDYIFFLEFEGHRLDDDVSRALDEIKKIVAFVKVLGSYPKKY